MVGKRVAILGGGNMGKAIARALWDNESTIGIASDQVVIAEPDAAKHTGLRERNSCTVVGSAREAMKLVAPDGILVIAVKPQMFAALASELGAVGDRLVISVMAGCPSERVGRDLGGRCRVVRAMPNLAVTEGHGMTGLSAGPGATPADLDFGRRVFGSVGTCIDIPESMMDAITAVASSGSAYVFYLAEAMAKAASEVGFEPQAAADIVKQTIWGAAWLLLEDPASAEDLRQRVTSKGGTTQAAIDVLDHSGVKDAIVRAIKAARDRGRELSQY